MSFDPALSPYLAVILLGFLPSEVWRWLSALIAHRIDENSEIFRLVRSIATALLVGVVLKIVATPARELAAVPLWARRRVTVRGGGVLRLPPLRARRHSRRRGGHCRGRLVVGSLTPVREWGRLSEISPPTG